MSTAQMLLSCFSSRRALFSQLGVSLGVGTSVKSPSSTSVDTSGIELGLLISMKASAFVVYDGRTWLCVSVVSPMFALITVFLESLGSLHIFAILGSILLVGGSKKCLHCLNSKLPLVIGIVLFLLAKMCCL